MSQDGVAPEAESERARLRREREHLRRLRINEAGVALAALLVSVTVIGVNAYNHRRGSQMVVLQPEDIVLYREEGPSGAALYLAVQVPMVNAAREYGDVVVRASASLGEDNAEFSYTALIEPMMSRDVERGLKNCPMDARCIPATGFLVIERPKELLDVPGGSSRTEFLSFTIENGLCTGDDSYCERFSGYEAAVQHLRSQWPASVSVALDFQFDGAKTLTCTFAADRERQAAILDYLDEKGWARPGCEARSLAEGSKFNLGSRS